MAGHAAPAGHCKAPSLRTPHTGLREETPEGGIRTSDARGPGSSRNSRLMLRALRSRPVSRKVCRLLRRLDASGAVYLDMPGDIITGKCDELQVEEPA